MFALEPVTVTDFSKAREFWKTVLRHIGYSPQHRFPQLQTFGKAPHSPNFSIVQGTGGHFKQIVIYLQVDDAKDVSAIFNEAIAAGGKSLAGEDGGGSGRVSDQNAGQRASFLDIDGNTVEVYVGDSCILE